MAPAGVFEPAKAVAAPGQSAAAFDQKVINRISADRMYEDVYHLTETIGPRVAGTPAEKETADFIK